MEQKFKNCYFKIPIKLKKRLDNLSKNLSKPKSTIIREALEIHLNEIEDFSLAINALEELKDGDHQKASKKIDKVIKNLREDSDDLCDFDFTIEALEELKDGDYKKAGKKIDKIVKNLKK